ncbi:AAA family ATPase [Rhodobacter sp. SGA-6-6]|uniref:AAA family ATPase n=1 Tax=Rhodobacter sp. SGA-6-6 TaxID=2710882 RepID=UPI0013EDDB5D|nr:AAA family ATPase [Rhodobacter sp. SGA-6-6]NGM45985.1 AAA family ATPase [Rhodobacter sp. SGA-6-6]
MLKETGEEGAAVRASGGEGRICAICDGLDAVMRLAGYIATLPAGLRRTDLSLAEALDHLRDNAGTRFERIVIAPRTDKDAAPRLVQAVLEAAARHTDSIVVLVPSGSRVRLAPVPGMQLLAGPPFMPIDPAPGTDLPPDAGPVAAGSRAAPAAGLSRLFGRRASGKDQPAPPPRPSLSAPPPAPRRVIAVQPFSGGSGATTLAVNLAAELAAMKPARNICLIDLNLQFGNVGTYLNLPADSRVLDAYRTIGGIDSDAFSNCLQRIRPNLAVFSAPREILPLDGIDGNDLRRLVMLARDMADLVILDLPHLVADWSGDAFAVSDCLFGVCSLDVRSAQNAAKLLDLLRSEKVTTGAPFYFLNRAPAKRSRAWKEEVAEFEKGLGVPFAEFLPDGGPEVTAACNAGAPLCDHAPKNPARTAIRALCEALHPTIGVPAGAPPRS